MRPRCVFVLCVGDDMLARTPHPAAINARLRPAVRGVAWGW
jgi:hypothetical protein